MGVIALATFGVRMGPVARLSKAKAVPFYDILNSLHHHDLQTGVAVLSATLTAKCKTRGQIARSQSGAGTFCRFSGARLGRLHSHSIFAVVATGTSFAAGSSWTAHWPAAAPQ